MRKPNCEKCKRKPCIKTGKPCKKVERWMNKQGIFRTDYIRPRVAGGKAWREIPMSGYKHIFDKPV